MPRNGGATIDVRNRTVLDRNGILYPLAALVITDDGLYYARPIDANEHFHYQERWVLPAPGWVINRFAFHVGRTDVCDWYVETDLIAIDGQAWRIRDGYLDVYVHDGDRYELEDAGELADGLAVKEITEGEVVDVLRALDRLCDALKANGCSGHALLETFAPTLPRSGIMRAADGTFATRDGPKT
jgi:predicted RNA-binding protein associated with RNAse of E/G family